MIADTLFYVGGAAVTSKFLLFVAVGALIGIGIRKGHLDTKERPE
jgi:hypothetical protein